MKLKGQTLMNISNGASNMASTSAGFGAALNASFSLSMPITGTTLSRCCAEANGSYIKFLIYPESISKLQTLHRNLQCLI